VECQYAFPQHALTRGFVTDPALVLLLDEADVFMESRNSNSLERNKLVAIFLRLLEYFEGIMFLTTNVSLLVCSDSFQSILTRSSVSNTWTQLSNLASTSVSTMQNLVRRLAIKFGRHSSNESQRLIICQRSQGLSRTDFRRYRSMVVKLRTFIRQRNYWLIDMTII
jgi:hypothetical protein